MRLLQWRSGFANLVESVLRSMIDLRLQTIQQHAISAIPAQSTLSVCVDYGGRYHKSTDVVAQTRSTAAVKISTAVISQRAVFRTLQCQHATQHARTILLSSFGRRFRKPPGLDFLLTTHSSDQFAPDCFTNTFPSASLSGFGCGSGAVIVDTVLPTFSGQAQVASSIIGAAASLKSVVATETATDDSDVTAILEEIDSLTSEAAFIATASITPGAANMGTAAVTESDVVVSWSRPADPSFQSIPFFTSPSGSAPTNNNNNNNQDQSSSTSPSPGLPPGLIAAIAVPTVIGAVILAALTVLLILCIRKRNRRRRAAQNPAIGPYTSPYAPPSAGNAYPDTYGVNKEFSVHSHNVVSPNSNPSMSVISPWSGSSPYPSGTAEMDGYGPHSVYYSPGLNRENLDALSRSGSGPRRSDELARERRLSEDGNTAVPEPSVAGRTNWTADTFAVAGGRRAGY